MNWNYIAGFFDGEGHVEMPSGIGYISPRICIVQTGQVGKKLLWRISDFLTLNGINSSVDSTVPQKGNHAEKFVLAIYGRNMILKFCEQILPLLFVKKSQTQDLIRFLKMYGSLKTKPMMSFRSSERYQRVAVGLGTEVRL